MKNLKDLVNFFMNFNIPRGASIALAGLVQARIMEAKYDELAGTKFFQKLKDLPSPQKAGIGSSLLSLSAFLEQFLGENTFLSRAFKQIAGDFGPEMLQRLYKDNEAKSMVIDISGTSGGPSGYLPESPKKAPEDILTDMEEQDLESFLDWLDSLPSEERETIERTFQFPSEKISRTIKFKPEIRTRLLRFLRKPKKGFLEKFTESMDAYSAELDRKMAEKKEKGGKNV